MLKAVVVLVAATVLLRCGRAVDPNKPVCKSEQKSSYGGAKGLTSEVECHVESKPGATAFRWAFNGTGDMIDIVSSFRTTADGSISVLRYTPRTELDFGSLLCWATNPLGLQSEPCVFHFYAAGVPDPPNNCSISNQTSSSFEIDCSEGYDGGIPQHFKMHVFDMKTRVLLANLTSSSPKFALHVGGQTSNAVGPMDSQRPHYGPDETPRTHSWKSNTVGGEITWHRVGGGSGGAGGAGGTGSIYGSIAVIPPVGTLLQVTAVNAHGNSESVFIDATSFVGLTPESQKGPVSNFEFTPTLGILIGIVVTGFLMMTALITGLKLRCNRSPPAMATNKDNKDNGVKETRKEYIELGTRDPDVIFKDKGIESSAHITNNPLDFLNSAVRSEQHVNGVTGGVGGGGGGSGGGSGGGGGGSLTFSSPTSTMRLNDQNAVTSQNEVVYAELTLARKQHGGHAPMQTLKSPENEPVVYAQIDHNRKSKHRMMQPPLVLPDINQISTLNYTDDVIRETTLI